MQGSISLRQGSVVIDRQDFFDGLVELVEGEGFEQGALRAQALGQAQVVGGSVLVAAGDGDNPGVGVLSRKRLRQLSSSSTTMMCATFVSFTTYTLGACGVALRT